MDHILSQEKISKIYEQSTREVTERTSGIRLSQGIATLRKEVCTVYTNFGQNVHSGIALCAETELFTRLTKQMMRVEEVDFQDIEDFVKEYFNVLCGHIAVALFRDTKTAVRFEIPTFYRGQFRPENQSESWTLHFISDQDEIADLIHYKAIDKADNSNTPPQTAEH